MRAAGHEKGAGEVDVAAAGGDDDQAHNGAAAGVGWGGLLSVERLIRSDDKPTVNIIEKSGTRECVARY